MRDPHVAALEYRLETRGALTFDHPPAITRETADYHLRLADGLLRVELKGHHASEQTAQSLVEPYLRAWEIEADLAFAGPAIVFSFLRAEVVDRDPPKGEAVNDTLAFEQGIGVTKASVARVQPAYPAPPEQFVASPDVITMWSRYQMYRDGRDQLLSMAYACLSLLEGTTGKKKGSHEAVCEKYSIAQAVRATLGELVSVKGSPLEARKLDIKATQTPLTDTERRWIEQVVQALIRRKGEYDFDPSAALPLLRMSDFPAL